VKSQGDEVSKIFQTVLMKSFVYLRALRAFVVEIWMVPLARTSAGGTKLAIIVA
jgi:hypothetical protein